MCGELAEDPQSSDRLAGSREPGGSIQTTHSTFTCSYVAFFFNLSSFENINENFVPGRLQSWPSSLFCLCLLRNFKPQISGLEIKRYACRQLFVSAGRK